eukprot:SAG31_NODE_8083_length_1526_cov_1.405746_2_plen_46_part_01
MQWFKVAAVFLAHASELFATGAYNDSKKLFIRRRRNRQQFIHLTKW